MVVTCKPEDYKNLDNWKVRANNSRNQYNLEIEVCDDENVRTSFRVASGDEGFMEFIKLPLFEEYKQDNCYRFLGNQKKTNNVIENENLRPIYELKERYENDYLDVVRRVDEKDTDDDLHIFTTCQLAEKFGMTENELIKNAIKEYVERHMGFKKE